MRFHSAVLIISIIFIVACSPEVEFETAAADELFGRSAANTAAAEIIVAPTATALPPSPTSGKPAPTPTQPGTRAATPLPTMTPPQTPEAPPPPTAANPAPLATFTPAAHLPTRVPPASPPPPPILLPLLPSGCQPPYGWEIHDIQPGDTLFSVAAAHELTPYELQRGNCVGDAQTFVAGEPVAVPAEIFPTTYDPPPSVIVDSPADCQTEAYAPSNGLAVGTLGEAITYAPTQHVEVWEETIGFKPYFGLLRGDTFTILEGPVCFTLHRSGEMQQTRRRWRVRTTLSLVEGWIDEYIGTADQYIYMTGPVGYYRPPEIETFTVFPTRPTLNDHIAIDWTVRHVSGVTISGGGIHEPPLSPTWTHTIAAADLELDQNGCAILTLIGHGANETVYASEEVCLEDNDSAAGCPYPRLTNDPTLPQDCPAGPPQTIDAIWQPFENGVIVWLGPAGESEQPVVIVMKNDTGAVAPPTPYFVGQTPPALEPPPDDLFSPGKELAYAWANYPDLRAEMGWATGPAVVYTSQRQTVAGHVVFVAPDGRQRRYLIYNGDFGMWVPIADQHIP